MNNNTVSVGKKGLNYLFAHQGDQQNSWHVQILALIPKVKYILKRLFLLVLGGWVISFPASEGYFKEIWTDEALGKAGKLWGKWFTFPR